MVTFAPNPGFPAVDKATEIQVVTTPEPDIGALMLAGIGFLLVMRKRCASGLTPTSYWAFLSIHSMCFT
jgi:hypothetical protein